jgi:hypothetical protein
MDLQNSQSVRPRHFCQHTNGCHVEVMAGQKFCQRHGSAIQSHKEWTVKRPAKKPQYKAARSVVILKEGPRGMPLGSGLSRCSKLDHERHEARLVAEEAARVARIARIVAGDPAEIQKSVDYYKGIKNPESSMLWLSSRSEAEYRAVTKVIEAEWALEPVQ